MRAGGPVLMFECDQCHVKAFSSDGRNPGRVLKCACCPLDHDHDKAANETDQPCRPLTIHVLPGTAQLKVME
jgi:hypothetical protein